MNFKLFLIAFLTFNIQFVFGQEKISHFNCYKEADHPPNTVFTKTEISPRYKYGKDSFMNYIIKNTNLTNLFYTRPERLFFDTAQVSFIVTKDHEINNLSISKTKNEFQKKRYYSII